MREGGPRSSVAWLLVALGFTVGACTSTGPTTATPAVSPPSPLRVETPPSWRPGDSWVYQWKSGEQTGIRIVHMQAIRNLNQMRFYVVSADGADQYWTSDLHWAGTVRDSKVEVRMTPPEPWFVWPLEVGRRWTHRGQYEDQSGKRDVEDAFAVVGIETITVPAGQFRALKVVRESHGLYSDQYWYVPEVRSYAKWIGRRGEIEFEWQLESYRPAPRLIPDAPGASTSPPR